MQLDLQALDEAFNELEADDEVQLDLQALNEAFNELEADEETGSDGSSSEHP
jgi:hypothetical protein